MLDRACFSWVAPTDGIILAILCSKPNKDSLVLGYPRCCSVTVTHPVYPMTHVVLTSDTPRIPNDPCCPDSWHTLYTHAVLTHPCTVYTHAVVAYHVLPILSWNTLCYPCRPDTPCTPMLSWHIYAVLTHPVLPLLSWHTLCYPCVIPTVGSLWSCPF